MMDIKPLQVNKLTTKFLGIMCPQDDEIAV